MQEEALNHLKLLWTKAMVVLRDEAAKWRWRTALRNRHADADSKPPQADVAENPMVVSVEEKAHEMCQVWIKKVSVELTNVSVEMAFDGVKIGVSLRLQD